VYRRSLRRWTSERLSRVVERRSSRQISVTTRKAWMLSPDPSLSMIESGYESDLSCRGRDWVFCVTHHWPRSDQLHRPASHVEAALPRDVTVSVDWILQWRESVRDGYMPF
jgi:hypothetical protein